jgi:hypothetical protein
MTMRHRAALACRSPAWLRRCRLLRPDDTGTGEVPQSAAKLASVASRSASRRVDCADRRSGPVCDRGTPGPS